VLGIMAAILASLYKQTADDLFSGPEGSPRTDRPIAASVQWAERIMRKIGWPVPKLGDCINNSAFATTFAHKIQAVY
jgi:hypothetical protein